MSNQFIIEDNILKSYLLDEKEVVIPEGIVSIGAGAFRDKTLTSVTLPTTLTSILSSAFERCLGLTHINIPENVSTIQSSAFNNCTNLESITVDENNSHFASFNNILYFNDLSQIYYVPLGIKGSISLSDKITLIDHKTFKGCANITNITIPQSVSRLGNSSFEGCSSLETVNIPEQIEDMSMVEGLFIGCKSLKKIIFGNKDLQVKIHWFGRKGTNKIQAVTDYDIINQLATSFYPAVLPKELKEFLVPQVATILVHDNDVDIEWKESWVKYIKSKRKSLYIQMMKYEDLLTVILNEKLLSLSELKDALAISKENSYIDVTSRLLDYENNNFTQKQVVKNTEKEIQSGLNLANNNISELKKNWGIKKNDDGSLIITGYKGNDKDVIVPQFIGKDQVCYINEFAFSPDGKRLTSEQKDVRRKITSITIPSGIKTIGEKTFYNCSNLETLTISDGVTEIGEKAFWYCSNLVNLTLPEGIKELNAYSKEDGNIRIKYSFICGCNKITSLSIPSTVCKIDKDAFRDCNDLEKIEVNENNNSYASLEGILYDKDMKTCVFVPNGYKGDINIPLGVTSVCSNTFSNCPKITSIVLPDSIKELVNVDFSQCPSLTKITLPKNLETFDCGPYTPFKNTSLQEIRVPSNITEICPDLFANTYSIKNIYLPEGLKKISEGSFYCSSVTSITIPDTVTEIGKDAFNECTDLTSIKFSENITKIEENTCRFCHSLTSITIPSKVTFIGERAFEDCLNVTSITIPSSVETIGSNAFSNCRSLKEITLPDSIKEMGKYVFLTSTNDLVIRGKEGSYVEKYAKENGLNFKAI